MASTDVGRRAERTADRIMGRHDETRWGVLTGEFWTTVVVIVATLIAAAVADNFDAPGAWWIVGVVASAYVVSRGLAKAGTPHRDGPRASDSR
jgi:cobalamin biosynthesis protein CobD/CbiB